VPKHHQVHHGTNKFCIDKNYAGVLIIWDRLYGTFEEKDDHKDEQIAYGLLHGSESFSFFYIQLRYYQYMFDEVISQSSFGAKLRKIYVFLTKGPGFNEKKPELRLGDLNDYPEGYPNYKYN
jgi:alkylglycerol monooxygenase